MGLYRALQSVSDVFSAVHPPSNIVAVSGFGSLQRCQQDGKRPAR